MPKCIYLRSEKESKFRQADRDDEGSGPAKQASTLQFGSFGSQENN
jgi:hypothetical protein